MSFAEITRLRVALETEPHPVVIVLQCDLPEWQQANPQARASKYEDEGVTYQQCGGGRRVLRKKIGGA